MHGAAISAVADRLPDAMTQVPVSAIRAQQRAAHPRNT